MSLADPVVQCWRPVYIDRWVKHHLSIIRASWAAGRRAARLLSGLGMLLLAACSAPLDQPTARPPTGVSTSPVIELLRGKTSSDKVCAVTDRQGVVHVIMASSSLRQVIEVRVPRHGELSRRVIRSGSLPWTVDAAFDRHGQLHVLLDEEHLAWDGQTWRGGLETPWQAAGVSVYAPAFVHGAPTLTWTFHVDGSDVGSPRRLDVYGFGGYGGALVWPWISSGSHAVMVAETHAGYGSWIVVSPDERLDSSVCDAASDAQGNVFLTYSLTRDGMLASSARRFVWIKAAWLSGAQSPTGGQGRSMGAVKMHAVSGGPVGDRSIVRRFAAGSPMSLTAPKGAYRGAERLSAGAGAVVHAMFLGQAHDEWFGNDYPVICQRHAGHGWSEPFELGHANSSSFWGGLWNSLAIAGDGSQRALVVWPSRDAMVGRWVEWAR